MENLEFTRMITALRVREEAELEYQKRKKEFMEACKNDVRVAYTTNDQSISGFSDSELPINYGDVDPDNLTAGG